MGLGVVSVCLPTYRPLFSMVIPKLRTKMASFGSGWDSDRGLQAALPAIPETEETPDSSDVTFVRDWVGRMQNQGWDRRDRNRVSRGRLIILGFWAGRWIWILSAAIRIGKIYLRLFGRRYNRTAEKEETSGTSYERLSTIFSTR